MRPRRNPDPQRRQKAVKCPCGSGIALAHGCFDCYKCHVSYDQKKMAARQGNRGSSCVMRGHEERMLYYAKCAAWELPLFEGVPEPDGWPEGYDDEGNLITDHPRWKGRGGKHPRAKTEFPKLHEDSA